MEQDFDLLGDPIPEGWGKRGRPSHVPTERNRNKIKLLQALGWNRSRIAKALGITQKTMKKHYSHEFRHMEESRARVDGERLMCLWEQVRSGNVAAMKEMDRVFTTQDRRAAEEAIRQSQSPGTPRIGKKEAAQQAAQSAGEGSDWGSDLLGPERTKH